ncbi:hypothetical protein [Amycolatopsis orientalis]|uniref:hypothetical protein n=1 Tax=Amycolatopsis orientalis TaxID=31958 RepID=UPI000399EEE1|nr:hypothetical protein [Amycolatopsis orientalis]
MQYEAPTAWFAPAAETPCWTRDPNTDPLQVLAGRMRRLALGLAEQFDRRNGNIFQGDRIRTRLPLNRSPTSCRSNRPAARR